MATRGSMPRGQHPSCLSTPQRMQAASAPAPAGKYVKANIVDSWAGETCVEGAKGWAHWSSGARRSFFSRDRFEPNRQRATASVCAPPRRPHSLTCLLTPLYNHTHADCPVKKPTEWDPKVFNASRECLAPAHLLPPPCPPPKGSCRWIRRVLAPAPPPPPPPSHAPSSHKHANTQSPSITTNSRQTHYNTTITTTHYTATTPTTHTTNNHYTHTHTHTHAIIIIIDTQHQQSTR